jgi:uncharacterized iron-regulated protein
MLTSSLLLLSSLLADLDKRIDDLFKGRSDRLVGEMHDLVLHELGHHRRLAAAERNGTAEKRRAAAQTATPETLLRENGDPLKPDTLWKELRRATVVHIAETHDHVRGHEIQLEVVQALGPHDLAVGLEMFPQSLQPVLDRWSAGELTEWDFLEGVNWYRTWGFPYRLFRPLFLYCRENRIPLVGLNAPADVNRKVGRGGLRSLDDADRARLPAEIVLTDAAHRRNFEEIMPHHPGMNTAKFYEAFCVWDEAMADAAARWLREKKTRLVVIAGNGHIRGRLGVPERARRRFDHTYRVLLTWDVRDAEANFDLMLAPGADYVWWTKEDHAPDPPKVGVGLDASLKVTAVSPDSPAAKAGVRVGDVLKTAGKRELKTDTSLRHFLEIRRSDEFTLTVVRSGKELPLRIQVPR